MCNIVQVVQIRELISLIMSKHILISISIIIILCFSLLMKYQLPVCYIYVKLTIKQSMKLVVNYNILCLIKLEHERLSIYFCNSSIMLTF